MEVLIVLADRRKNYYGILIWMYFY